MDINFIQTKLFHTSSRYSSLCRNCTNAGTVHH